MDIPLQHTVQTNLGLIQSTIATARVHEQQTAELKSLLEQQLPSLHTAIELPSHNSVDTLHGFIMDYIQHVPQFIEAIHTLAEDAKIDEPISYVLKVASDFFLEPPQLLESHSGMRALMDESYLAHRLIEEVNDRFINLCGQPLAPMDMTRSNLIIHYLIGEPFANELDSAVQYCVDLIMARHSSIQSEAFQAYIEEHRDNGWYEEIKRWPCLAEDLSINLNFTSNFPAAADSPKTILN
ncbi:MAG: hypothetical protein AseanaTS_11790 [Candidatus Pelagadaptatus aseana]|uniref:hypothetical protein n=1 Tax=Candidatus Pelagadaptatus aseana TaxID=3120508 RepID=UPI0039B2F6BD